MLCLTRGRSALQILRLMTQEHRHETLVACTVIVGRIVGAVDITHPLGRHRAVAAGLRRSSCDAALDAAIASAGWDRTAAADNAAPVSARGRRGHQIWPLCCTRRAAHIPNITTRYFRHGAARYPG